MKQALKIGHLLRASTRGFVAGCHVTQVEAPHLGALVCVPVNDHLQIFGVIYDLHIDDDGLVRQLVTSGNMTESVRADTRERRIVPIEISVQAVGYAQNGRIYHLLPPQPPLSLDEMFLCDDEEIVRFAAPRRFGYLRHLLGNKDLALGDVLAAHALQIQAAQQQHGQADWQTHAVREIITLLRDDYARLMDVLAALNDIMEGIPA